MYRQQIYKGINYQCCMDESLATPGQLGKAQLVRLDEASTQPPPPTSFGVGWAPVGWPSVAG